MYVSELDRPWTDSTFLFQGFLIESEEQIRELQAQCSYVIVSQESSLPGIFETAGAKSKAASGLNIRPVAIRNSASPAVKNLSPDKSKWGGIFNAIKQISKDLLASSKSDEQNSSNPFFIEDQERNDLAESRRRQEITKIRENYAKYGEITTEIVDYPIETTLEQEYVAAKAATTKFEKQLAASLMLEMTGENLSRRIDVAKDLLADVVDSIIRNPEAMFLVRQLKDIDDVTYHHALDVSVMLVSFGRQLGLPKKELNEIALGGLLHDIGKSRIPSEIIHKKGTLTDDELRVARTHVKLGIEVVQGLDNLGDIVLQVIERHHERYDGKGYPTGLSGEEIGLYGSMAAIVETFSSITSYQPYSEARSSAQAVSVLVSLRDEAFQGELVDQFIQVVGVYPMASVVKLSSGEVGIVIKQNRLWRLKPVVSIVIDANGNRLPSPMTIDLARPPQLDVEPPSIITELPSGAYDIDPKEYFL